jgi:peptidoglycan hydrolase-like protein with peptidoglycan-binding domain
VQDVVRVARDGLAGPGTKAAVAGWQPTHNLAADGLAGPATMREMQITRNHGCSGPTAGGPAPGSSAVAQLQWDLAGLGYLPWSAIDGVAGPQTAGATQAFQADRCLAVDGVAGPNTNAALIAVVKQVQQRSATTADGAYGPATRLKVAAWQTSHQISADGQAGPQTMTAMGVSRSVHCSGPPSGTPAPSASPTAVLQWDLAGLGYLPWSGIDGISGPQTVGAVQAFQSNRCLSVDGIAGPQTVAALAGVVKQVQQVAGTTADGGYGPNTRAAVATWQTAHQLVADGQAGPGTMTAMGITRVQCTTPQPPPPGPPSGDVGAGISSVAYGELNNASRNHESGGYNCNFYSAALGVGSACSNGLRSEEWCSDFATWVWRQAGAVYGGLTPAASSFYAYGRQHNTWHTTGPRVGDAVVFNLSASGTWASHVGLVVAVSGGSFTMISGNTFNPANGKDDIVGLTTQSNSGGGISGFTDPATAAPAPNNKVAFDYFVGQGLSKIQSAAIVGNLNQESGASMDPRAAQSPGLGRGIAQWSVGGRWDHDASDNVVWYAGQKLQSQWALNLQLGFTWYELTTFSNYGLVPLRASGTVTDAVVAFQNRFEGCGVCVTSNRIRYANQALAAFG